MATNAEDKVAIHELLTQLYLALDGHRPEDFAACFTAGGVFSAVYGEYKGHEAIAGFIREHIRKGNEDNARHLLTNLQVEPSAGGSAVRCYVTKIRLQPAPITIIAYADLEAKLVKQGSAWRFDHFKISITFA